MVFDFTNVNWVAIVVAAVSAVVIGFIWYMPAVFGRRWAAEVGRDLPTAGEVNPAIYLVSVGQALLIAYVLALFIGATGAATLVDHLLVAFVAWLGFAAVPTFNLVVYERRSVEYWLISVGFGLVSLLLMAAIFAYM